MNNMYDIDMGYLDMEGYMPMEGTETTESAGITIDGLLSEWSFVGGVTGGVLLVSILIGLLLAKLRIKEGFDVYED